MFNKKHPKKQRQTKKTGQQTLHGKQHKTTQPKRIDKNKNQKSETTKEQTRGWETKNTKRHVKHNNGKKK